MENEISKQLIWLEGEISRQLCDIRILHNDCERMEGELSQFVDSYMHAVSPVFDRLAELDLVIEEYRSNGLLPDSLHFLEEKPETAARPKKQKRSGMRLAPVSSDNSGDNRKEQEDTQQAMDATQILAQLQREQELNRIDDHSSDTVRAEVKQLYRKLVKIVHPDSNGKAGEQDGKALISPEMFEMLQDSYKSGDLAALIRLEQTVQSTLAHPQESDLNRLERLEKQHDMLSRQSDGLKVRKHHISSSPTYNLKKQVQWYKMCGKDLVATIIERVEEEISQKQRILEYIKQKKAS